MYDVGVVNPKDIESKKSDDQEYLKKVHKFGKKFDATTLDDVFKDKEHIPNILKMDVHGAEGKILAGSNKLLSNNIKYLLMELHTDNDFKKIFSWFFESKNNSKFNRK